MGTETPRSARLSRRRFTSLGGAALVATAAGATAHAQIDSTPPSLEPPSPGNIAAETIEAVAARLGYDVEAMVGFVRDEIAYEPYAGVLRGASGTLWARAGNSADQAELLGALLTASHITFRLAAGPLDAAKGDVLRSAASRTRDNVLDAWERAAIARDPATGVPAEPPDTLDDLRSEGAIVLDGAGAQTDALTQSIQAALDDAGIALPEPGDILPEFELSRHAWVQIADGPEWIDVDPSLPASSPLTAPTMTMAEWPPEWHHQVVLSIDGEHLTSGTLTRRQACSLTANSRALAGVPVILGMVSPDALAGIGFAITEAIGGQVSAVPWFLANETTAIAASPLAFTINADSASSAFGDETLPDDECVAIWLVTTITSPDGTSRTVERSLMDRVPAEDRATGTIDPGRISPVPIGANGVDPDIMTRLTLIHTELARTPPVAAIRRAEADPNLGALGAIGPMLTTLRDTVGGGLELDRGAWSYPSGPAVTAFHLDPGDPNDPESPVFLHADLIHHERSVARIDGEQPGDDIHPLLRSGVLDAVSEALLLDPPMEEDLAIPATGPNIIRIFETATREGVDVRAVQAAAELDALDLTPAARLRIEASIAEGHLAVVPVQPVEIDGVPTTGWWIVDPFTGRTWDRLVDGTGGASIRLSGGGRAMAMLGIPEYGVLLENIVAVLEQRLLCFLGAVVARSVILALVALAVTGGPDSRIGAYLTGLGIGAGAATTGALVATC
jgi:transglutaminase-like putative cysteine protease